MISVQDAIQLITNNLTPLSKEWISLESSCDRYSAVDVNSPLDVPAFHQSAMDGYAYAYDKWDKHSALKVVGEVAAGIWPEMQLQNNQAVRIFTGAAVPESADSVIMQEKVRREADEIQLNESDAIKGTHIRLRGSQIGKGELAFAAGTRLTPAAIGFLASMGISRVCVYRKPRVRIIVTGSELIAPGDEPSPGKVFESNSFALATALHAQAEITRCPDNEDAIRDAMEQAFPVCDLMLITGGISVGDYDFVLPALQTCGAQIHFHKVRQKPAKPLAFASCKGKPVFALPGNPASVMTCFYAFVQPVLQIMQGYASAFDQVEFWPLQNPVEKKPGMTHFLKARTGSKQVEILKGQESYRMDTFALANALVVLPEDVVKMKAGEEVMVIRMQS